jgi:hypothetical protein
MNGHVVAFHHELTRLFREGLTRHRTSFHQLYRETWELRRVAAEGNRRRIWLKF